MTDMLLDYGLFLAQTLTVIVGVAALIGVVATIARRESSTEHSTLR